MSEQTEQQDQSAQPQPEPQPQPPAGDRWGDSLSDERQCELQARRDAWDAPGADQGGKKGPFDGVRLTGARVFWLAAQALAGPNGDRTAAQERLRSAGECGAFIHLSALHLDRADLTEAQLVGASLVGAQLEEAILEGAHLEGANLRFAHLEGANLCGAHLERAFLYGAQLVGASLIGAQLEGAILEGAHLEGANLRFAHLEGANLCGAHLERAFLTGAQLVGASLGRARLEGANLEGAHLERAGLRKVHLEGADLRRATLDGTTQLERAVLAQRPSLLGRLLRHNTSAALGDMRWGSVGTVDLTAVHWNPVLRLGDERLAGLRAGADAHEAVVRSYRQLAAQLRAQGMSEVADHFAYRAQIRQRGVLLRRFRLPQYVGSWVLAVLAGYGYRPGRTIFWYLAVVAGFTVLYMQATHGWVPFGRPAPPSLAPLPWYEALILSVSSFHGRGFFQPLPSLGDPIAALAAIEAVVGLFIEISFLATFTHRFFGAK